MSERATNATIQTREKDCVQVKTRGERVVEVKVLVRV
jgi:hypothetical protein